MTYRKDNLIRMVLICYLSLLFQMMWIGNNIDGNFPKINRTKNPIEYSFRWYILDILINWFTHQAVVVRFSMMCTLAIYQDEAKKEIVNDQLTYLL
jgi:hypothetical protein